MDGVEDLSPRQQNLVDLFLEIAKGQTPYFARQFLQAASWNLEEAVQLFYSHDQEGEALETESETETESELESELEPKLEPELDKEHGPATITSWSSIGTSRDNLAELYRPPYKLMYHGPFHMAKEAARVQNKWLLVNVQSMREFTSHVLNRDTWANEVVAETIRSNYFILWQIYDDTEEGRKVCSYYKLLADSETNNTLPLIMVIDPVTGQKLSCWCGMVQPETLLENLVQFMDGTPKDHHVNRLRRRRPQQVQEVEKDEEEEHDDNPMVVEESKTAVYPALPEEPKGGDGNVVCRVGVRLPDGQRVHRNFLRSDSVQLLWSFVYSQLDEEAAKTRAFSLKQAIPGSSKSLDYDTELSFEASGIANSMVSVAWE